MENNDGLTPAIYEKKGGRGERPATIDGRNSADKYWMSLSK